VGRGLAKRILGTGAAFQAARRLFYLGRRVECPCCEGRFRRFVVLEEYAETERACPRCDSYARHRLVWLYLRDETDLLGARLRVLHVAPTDPMYQERLSALPNLDYLSADIEAPEAMERMDITDIRHPDGSFDVVLCSHVLEHVPDDGDALRELHRVLRPGGWALVQSPVDPRREATFEDPSIVSPEDRLRAFNQPDHVRVYGRDYPDRLRAAGFDVEVRDYVSELPPAAGQRYGLDPVEPIHRCTKR
jgi:SAM-dependent methyltransferase